jgi:arginase family enzyme
MCVDANGVRAAWERAASHAAEAEARAARDEASAARDDAPAFMDAPLAASAPDLEGAVAVALGIPYGGVDPEVAAGAAAIRRHSVDVTPQGRLEPCSGADCRLDAVRSVRLVDYGDVLVEADDVEATFVRAHDKLADIFAAGAVPIVFGGDHSITIPILQVLAGKLSGKLGIVAFDARLDLDYEPRYRAGSQWARAFELGVVEPTNFVEIGAREGPGSRAEQCVADELGIRAYTMAEIDELGIATVAQEALEAAAAGTEAVYLSLDTDAVDPADGGPGSSGSTGLSARELLRALRTLAGASVAGLDVCGLAPRRDPQGHVGRVAVRAVHEVLAGLAGQRP